MGPVDPVQARRGHGHVCFAPGELMNILMSLLASWLSSSSSWLTCRAHVTFSTHCQATKSGPCCELWVLHLGAAVCSFSDSCGCPGARGSNM
jgi:hypothetical protein